jgi:hypothetical protein
MLGPGVVAGLVPWWVTGWRTSELPPFGLPIRILGAALIAGGLITLVQAFARFVSEGVGTPAPVAPPQQQVVGGLYRYVRNPMYLAVLALIVGQALLLGRWELLLYAGIVALAFITFVRVYEEPTLRARSDHTMMPTAAPCLAGGRAATPGSPRLSTGLGQRTEAGRLAFGSASARRRRIIRVVVIANKGIWPTA